LQIRSKSIKGSTITFSTKSKKKCEKPSVLGVQQIARNLKKQKDNAAPKKEVQ
jgi:hypothetical protein